MNVPRPAGPALGSGVGEAGAGAGAGVPYAPGCISMAPPQGQQWSAQQMPQDPNAQYRGPQQ